MSALDANAKAARIMADAFGEAAESCGDDQNGYLLARISQAYMLGSRAMEALARTEALGLGGACSINHATLKVPKCPACGARRASMPPPAGDPV